MINHDLDKLAQAPVAQVTFEKISRSSIAGLADIRIRKKEWF